MSSSALTRIQHSSITNYSSYDDNNNDHGKHTISICRLLFYLLDYIYLLNAKLFLYFITFSKQILRFIIRFCAFIFVTIHESKKKIIQFQFVKYYNCPLQPISIHRLHFLPKKILVLDLDETLIHSDCNGSLSSMTVKPTIPPDFVVRVELEKHPMRFFVYKRPHVDYFLEIVSHWYELVIFTASMEIYSAPVIDKLDNNRNILVHRFYRHHCKFKFGSYTKDLAVINNDLSRIFILDNNPIAYRSYPKNAIPIKSWFFDPNDTCLLALLPFLDALRFCRDVRSVLTMNLHLHQNLLMTNTNSLITQVMLPST